MPPAKQDQQVIEKSNYFFLIKDSELCDKNANCNAFCLCTTCTRNVQAIVKLFLNFFSKKVIRTLISVSHDSRGRTDTTSVFWLGIESYYG